MKLKVKIYDWKPLILTFFRNVVKATEYLQSNEIAHNVFITRGTCFHENAQDTVRVYIWPRVKFIGMYILFSLNCFFSTSWMGRYAA